MENVGTHITHCCKTHGCKYGYSHIGKVCPVESGEAKQSGPCEDCNESFFEEKNKVEQNSTQRKIQIVLDILLGTKHLVDHGHCDAKGRVLTSRKIIGNCQIDSTFSRINGTYVLKHTLSCNSQSTALGIMEAAIELAKMQEQTPKFLSDTYNDIHVVLDNLLGKK